MRWVAINIAAGLVALVVFTIVVNFNESYHWLWYKFTKQNLANMEMDKSMSNDDKLTRKLGIDYSYVLTLRALTPENAVIYYPTREEFLARPTHGPKLNFKGTMVDKLAAVRVLYPRRVVMREELGHTPYAANLSHISIINGLNRDMVSYPNDTTQTMDVLPTDPKYYIPY